MIKKIKSLIREFGTLSIGLSLALVTLMGVSIAKGWSEPTAPFPGGNLEAPINISLTGQTKTGPLQVNGFWNNGDTLLDHNLTLAKTVDATTGVIYSGTDRFIHNYGELGEFNFFAGVNAGNFTMSGGGNVAVGDSDLSNNTTGHSNTSIGYIALPSNTTGSWNVANGSNALRHNTTGNSNIATGFEALFYNTSGHDNIADGTKALLFNTTGSYNSAVGSMALFSNTVGIYNTAMSYAALTNNITGSYNSAVGSQALSSNTTGIYNIAMGTAALNSNILGNYNTAVGSAALMSNNSGNYNTAVGAFALISNNIGGSYNTALGYNSGVTINNLTNATAIGYNAKVGNSNNVRVGDENITWIGGKVAWSPASDVRLKKEIKDSDLGIEFIKTLRPVSFRWKQGDNGVNYGFIAQEIEKALAGTEAGMVSTAGDEMQTKSLRYTDLIAPLVKAVQEQQQQITELKSQIEVLKNK